MARLPRMSLYWYRRLFTQIYRKRDDDGEVTPPEPPEVPVILSPSTTSDQTPPVTGTGEAGATLTLEFYLSASLVLTGTPTVDGSGNWSYTPSSDLAIGSYVLKAFQTVDELDSEYTADFNMAITYVSQAVSYFARCTDQPITARKLLLDTVFRRLITAGIYAKLDTLVLIAAHSANDFHRNLISATQDLTIQNDASKTNFTTDRGYASDGVSKHLQHVSPTTLTKFTLNDACTFFIINGTEVVSQTPIISTPSSSGKRISLNPRGSGGNMMLGLNSIATLSAAVASRVGFYYIGINDSANQQMSKNAGARTTGVRNNQLVNASVITICRIDALYPMDRVALYGMGAYLTPTEEAELYDIVGDYMTAIGA